MDLDGPDTELSVSMRKDERAILSRAFEPAQVEVLLTIDGEKVHPYAVCPEMLYAMRDFCIVGIRKQLFVPEEVNFMGYIFHQVCHVLTPVGAGEFILYVLEKHDHVVLQSLIKDPLAIMCYGIVFMKEEERPAYQPNYSYVFERVATKNRKPAVKKTSDVATTPYKNRSRAYSVIVEDGDVSTVCIDYSVLKKKKHGMKKYHLSGPYTSSYVEQAVSQAFTPFLKAVETKQRCIPLERSIMKDPNKRTFPYRRDVAIVIPSGEGKTTMEAKFDLCYDHESFLNPHIFRRLREEWKKTGDFSALKNMNDYLSLSLKGRYGRIILTWSPESVCGETPCSIPVIGVYLLYEPTGIRQNYVNRADLQMRYPRSIEYFSDFSERDHAVSQIVNEIDSNGVADLFCVICSRKVSQHS